MELYHGDGKGSNRGERGRETEHSRGRNRRQMGECLSGEEIMEAQQMGREGKRSEEDKRHRW